MSLGWLLLPSTLVGVCGGILLAAEAPELVAPSSLTVVGSALLLSAAAGRAGGGRRRRIGVAGLALLIGLVAGSLRQGQPAPPAGPDSLAIHIGNEVGVEGTLADEPRPRGDRMQVVLDAVTVAAPPDDRLRPAEGRLLAWLPRSQPLSAGDRIGFTGRLDAPRDFEGFAYQAYLARQGIGAIARAFEMRVVGHPGAALESLSVVRRALLDGLNRLVPEPEAALGAGILLGVRTGISPHIEEAFATAGLTHVVAISGWNIAIVAALTTRLAGRLRGAARGRATRTLLLAGTVGGYVMLTGASPSVVRAGLMAGAMLVAQLAGSNAHGLAALMLAALLMLLAAPVVLWDVGFQLSCLATAGLILLGPAVAARLAGWPALIREPVALTTAAQLATLPVIVGNFDRLSLVAPAANVVVAPMMPLVMAASAAAALVGALGIAQFPLLGDAAAWAIGGAAWLYLRSMIVAGGAFAALPGAALDVSLPGPLLLAWYPFLTIAWLARRRRGAGSHSVPHLSPVGDRGSPAGRAARRVATRTREAISRGGVRALLLATGVALGTLHLASLPDGRLHLTVLDVGQGDAILIETPRGGAVLIDGGPDPELTLRKLGEALPFHQRRIDAVLLTHPHQDHVAGLVEVLVRYRVGLVLHGARAYDNAAYDAMLALAAQEGPGGIGVARVAAAGMVIRLDPDTTLEILYPGTDDLAAPLPYADINNASVVAMLRFESFSALLTGDAEAQVERLLIARRLLEPLDLLKVAHHGSESSSTPPFLEATRPALAVISAGADNEYGHPSPQTLAALSGVSGLRLYRTDLHGDVEIVSDGRERWVVTERRPIAPGG